jgi:hypothetical protein
MLLLVGGAGGGGVQVAMLGGDGNPTRALSVAWPFLVCTLASYGQDFDVKPDLNPINIACVFRKGNFGLGLIALHVTDFRAGDFLLVSSPTESSLPTPHSPTPSPLPPAASSLIRLRARYTTEALDLHMDLSYYESPPGIQMLHCLQNDTTTLVGGESTFIDVHHCAELFREEEPEHFRTLCEVPATFIKVRLALVALVVLVAGGRGRGSGVGAGGACAGGAGG